jgi:hypothetical protein
VMYRENGAEPSNDPGPVVPRGPRPPTWALAAFLTAAAGVITWCAEAGHLAPAVSLMTACTFVGLWLGNRAVSGNL